MIIDDFDSGIDGVRLALLCELLHDTQRRTGGTDLLSTHDMAAARGLPTTSRSSTRAGSSPPDPPGRCSTPPSRLARQLVAGSARGPLGLRD